MKVLILLHIKKTSPLKYFISFYYILRSIILRGPFNSWRLFWNESIFEKQFNIHTSEFLRSTSSEYFHYQGASYIVLFRLFKELDSYTKKFRFVDIGSGKGRVVFVAESFGFNDLIGIELNESLVDDAQINLQTFTSKRKNSTIRFLLINALEFEYKNEPTVYFLFNPFNAAVLKQVLEKIIHTTVTETWFLYMNPIYREVFTSLGIQQEKVIKTGFYTEAIIYKLNCQPLH